MHSNILVAIKTVTAFCRTYIFHKCVYWYSYLLCYVQDLLENQSTLI